MNIETIKALKERAKEMFEDNYNRKIGAEEIYTIIVELENFYTAYEKEKEKNMELTNSYNQAIKETNEENRRCMLLAVENQDLKEKNKRLEKFIENGEHTWKQKYNETFNYVEDEFVSKDKIRLKMKQEMDKGYRLSEERHLQNYAYDRLKELLEE